MTRMLIRSGLAEYFAKQFRMVHVFYLINICYVWIAPLTLVSYEPTICELAKGQLISKANFKVFI
jgi:hypothetical protein